MDDSLEGSTEAAESGPITVNTSDPMSSSSPWFLTDPFLTDLMETLAAWKIIRHRMERGKSRKALSSVLKELRSLRQQYLRAASESDDTNGESSLEPLRQLIKDKVHAAQATIVDPLQEEHLQIRPFNMNIFDMDAYYREHAPIPGSGSPASSSVAAAGASSSTTKNPSAVAPLRPPTTAATSPSSPSSSSGKATTRAATRRRESVWERRQDTIGNTLHHFVVDITNVEMWIGQEATLHFSLYSLTDDRVVSEEAQVSLGTHYPPKLDKARSRIIFRDVPAALLEDLWLIVRVIRLGRIKYDAIKYQQLLANGLTSSSTSSTSTSGGSGVSSSDVRRPYACAAIQVSELGVDKRGVESTLSFYAPHDESSFSSCHQLIINHAKQDVLHTVSPKGMRVNVRHWKGAWADLEATYASTLKRGGAAFGLSCRPLSIPDSENVQTLARSIRHDLYFTLEEGSFNDGGKNMELIIEGRTVDGTPCPGCSFKSVVYYHSGDPKWAEMYRIDLDRVRDLHHFYIEVRHAHEGGKFSDLSFSFTKLFNHDGSFISNGTRRLPCYKLPQKSSSSSSSSSVGGFSATSDPVHYLKENNGGNSSNTLGAGGTGHVGAMLGGGGGGGSSSASASMSALALASASTPSSDLPLTGDFLRVSTLLLSTKYSDNVPLMSLLNWKGSQQSITDILNKCLIIGKKDVAKFHKEIFETLMEIMELLPDVAGLALNVLTGMFASAIVIEGGGAGGAPPSTTSSSSSVDALQILLEQYIDNNFQNARASHLIIDSLARLLQDIDSRASHRNLAIALKSMTLLLRLIIKSRREWHLRKVGGTLSVTGGVGSSSSTSTNNTTNTVTNVLQLDEEFKAELGWLLSHLIKLVGVNQPLLIGVQTKLARTFPAIIEAIKPVYSHDELRSIIEDFLDVFHVDSPNLNIEKMLLMENFMSASLVSQECILKHLKYHLRRSKEEKLYATRLFTSIVKPLYDKWQHLSAQGHDGALGAIITTASSSASSSPKVGRSSLSSSSSSSSSASSSSSSTGSMAAAAGPGAGLPKTSSTGRIKLKGKDLELVARKASNSDATNTDADTDTDTNTNTVDQVGTAQKSPSLRSRGGDGNSSPKLPHTTTAAAAATADHVQHQKSWSKDKDSRKSVGPLSAAAIFSPVTDTANTATPMSPSTLLTEQQQDAFEAGIVSRMLAKQQQQHHQHRSRFIGTLTQDQIDRLPHRRFLVNSSTNANTNTNERDEGDSKATHNQIGGSVGRKRASLSASSILPRKPIYAQLLALLPPLSKLLCKDMAFVLTNARSTDDTNSTTTTTTAATNTNTPTATPTSAGSVIATPSETKQHQSGGGFQWMADSDFYSRMEVSTLLLALVYMISHRQYVAHTGMPASVTPTTAAATATTRFSPKGRKIAKSLLEAMIALASADYTYPLMWTDMVMFEFICIRKVVAMLKPYIASIYSPSMSDEDLYLWARFTKLNAAAIHHQALQLEKFSLARGARILASPGLGDFRLGFLHTLKWAWTKFEQYQLLLVPELVTHLVIMMMCENPRIKSASLALYVALLQRESHLSDDDSFPQFQVQTIQALESISKSVHWNEAALRHVFEVDVKGAVVALSRRRPTMATRGNSATNLMTTTVASSPTATTPTKPSTRGSRGFVSNAACQRAFDFARDVQSLLSLLSELRELPSGPEYEEERAFALSQLMTYLRQTQHGDAYAKYAHKLAFMYEEAEQYVEAGLAVMLHCDQLSRTAASSPEGGSASSSNNTPTTVTTTPAATATTTTTITPASSSSMLMQKAGGGWSNVLLPAVLHYPPQPQCDRKRALLEQALSLFEKGKAWEHAIGVLNELIEGCRVVYFDYYTLSYYLRKQAELYEKIVSQDRFFSNYFYVAYYGADFPKALRRKSFIYRGLELERIHNFIQRMQSKFPRAEILKSVDPDLLLQQQSTRKGQFLHIFSVQPSSEEEMAGQNRVQFNTAMPDRIQKFHQANQVKVFFYTRPFQQQQATSSSASSAPQNEFASLWIAKTFVVTEDTFPNVQRRLEICERREVMLSPLENAVNSVVAKNEELLDVISKFSLAQQPHPPASSAGPIKIDRLSMILNGIIDAAVNGGTAKYQEAFLSAKFRSANKDKQQLIDRLDAALVNQVRILGRGLHVHGQFCPESLLALHAHLEASLIKLCTQVDVEYLHIYTPRERAGVTVSLLPKSKSASILNIATANNAGIGLSK